MTTEKQGLTFNGLAILFAAVLISYLHSYSAPFYLDDYHSIVLNATLQNGLSNYINSKPSFDRLFTDSLFAINYSISGTATWSYHAINILIHFFNGILVYAITAKLINAELEKSGLPLPEWLPITAALLFCLNPLQSQAITYIVQRATCLATLFYLIGVLAYINWRQSSRIQWLALLGLGILGGILSKLTIVTLPLSLAILELIFFSKSRKSQYLSISIIAISIISAVCLITFPALADKVGGLRGTTAISRTDYLLSQTQVLWIYIAKFFFPLGLRLEYDFSPVRELDGTTITAILAHVALITVAMKLRLQSRLITFGILFYYAAHLPQSSVIPLDDLVFEHRSYLPNFGLCVAVAGALGLIAERVNKKDLVRNITFALCGVLLILTWQRNQLWRQPVAFYQDNAEKSPGAWRVWAALAEQDLQQGNPQKALETLRKGLTVVRHGKEASSVEITPEMASQLAKVLVILDHNQEAIDIIDQMLNGGVHIPPYTVANMNYNRGIAYLKQQQRDMARQNFAEAINTYPNHLDAINALAGLELMEGKPAQAQPLYQRILSIDPNNQAAHQGLKMVEQLKGTAK